MNNKLSLRIKKLLLKELVRRKLIEFFISKGYKDSFDRPIYPPIVYDIQLIPELSTKCEVVPSVVETDQALGIVTIEWNLFVLGINRLCLGTSSHNNHVDLIRSISGADSNSQFESKSTPAEVIEFILKILDNSKTGFIEIPRNIVPQNIVNLDILGGGRASRTNYSSSGIFYSK